MINEFIPITEGIRNLVAQWETRLSALDLGIIVQRKNCQNRTVRQIVGHMIDSASNNLHRIVHLQYGTDPLVFPNYASEGNNDRWIAIQNFQEEDWDLIVGLWVYSNLHLAHVIDNIDPTKLDRRWIAASNVEETLSDMVIDYLRHLKLHIGEVEELIG